MFSSARILYALVALNFVALLTLAAPAPVPATCPAPKKIAQQAQMSTQQTEQPVQVAKQPVQQAKQPAKQAKQPVQQAKQPAKQVPTNSTQLAEQSSTIQTTQSSLQVQDLSGQDCCGYTITNRDNAYFRYRLVSDFSSASLAEITSQGWQITDGDKAGATNGATGQEPIGSKNNVKLIPGEGMSMTVPAQDKGAASFSSAEIVFPDILGGIFETEAKLSNVKGTCQGFFTYTKPGHDWHDEQDIEILGVSLMAPATSPAPQPAGMQMTAYDPATGKTSTVSSPFPVDPSKGYHRYAIEWFPTTSSSNEPRNTQMRFDGKAIPSPKQYFSTHASSYIINHWSSGDPGWSAGPPTEDATIYIKKVVAYYDKPAAVAEGSDVLMATCDRAKACKVTI